MSLFSKGFYYVAGGRKCQLNKVKNCLGIGRVLSAAEIASHTQIKKNTVLLHLSYLLEMNAAVKVEGNKETFVGIKNEEYEKTQCCHWVKLC